MAQPNLGPSRAINESTPIVATEFKLSRLIDMANEWYALHVKPHKEAVVARFLKTRGYEVYYPALKVEPVNPRARREKPFFPGYIFIQLELSDANSRLLRWTEGTHGLVEFGGEPASVPENLVDELKKRLVKLQAGKPASAAALRKGDRVRIIDGAFEGYEGIFDVRLPDRDRAQVLLTYLREQPKKLRIESSHLLKIESKDD